ncbi:MAG: FxLYD domain-containing protein [Candidatus Bathyarchaeia archaeon]|jgi:hypothetical protein
MKKGKVFVIMLVAVICLGSVSIPHAFSQTNTGVKVLSYSWYIRQSDGDFIVVGEVQNTGNTILQSVTLNATVYNGLETELAASSAMAYVSYLLPRQKAPFYIDFGNPGTETPSVGSVDFNVFNANATSYEEYQSLTLHSGSGVILNGAYQVTGVVYNSGNQTANDIRVVGTYYNSTGGVVAVGFDILNETLPPINATSFTVSEFDATPSIVAQISNYSLIAQTSTIALPSATPTIPPTKSPIGGTVPSVYFYATVIGVILAVILIVTTVLMFRKRKVASAPPPPPPPPPVEYKPLFSISPKSEYALLKI